MARSKRQTTSNQTRKSVKRTTRHFQLRVEHPHDNHVREILDYAKSQRREVTLIRDAVTLFYALEQGNLEALFDKFPQFKTRFTTSSGGNGAGGSDLAREIAEQLALINGIGGYVMKSASTPKPAPKAEVKQAAMLSADAIADNFLSMFD